MQYLWIGADVIRPREGSGDRVNDDRSEALVVVVVDRCEDARQDSGEVEFTHEAVRERDAESCSTGNRTLWLIRTGVSWSASMTL
jgi:hypothetical protein